MDGRKRRFPWRCDSMRLNSRPLRLCSNSRLSAGSSHWPTPLFAHARRFTDQISDPAALLARLEDANFVVTSSNDWFTTVAAGWGAKTVAAIIGRCSRVLGKVTLPRLVEAVFYLGLQSALGEISEAQFGIGYLSFGPLGRLAAGAEPEPRLGGGGGYVNRRSLNEHRLLVRGLIADDVPFWCAARYDSKDECMRAQTNTEALEKDIVGWRAQVVDVLPHPSGTVGIQRFALALARARGDPDARTPRTGTRYPHTPSAK